MSDPYRTQPALEPVSDPFPSCKECGEQLSNKFHYVDDDGSIACVNEWMRQLMKTKAKD